MRNASTEDAERGWEIFRDTEDYLSLEEINKQLAKEGRGPIHQRMHTHYQNLWTHGLIHYVPINKFDVQRSLGLL